MTFDDELLAARSLRDLAAWIVRDRVDAGHLNSYMRDLLSAHLMELPASCRREASVIAERYPRLSPRHVAGRLLDRAREMEQAAASSSLQRAHEAQSAARSSCMPEFIGMAIFTVLGIAILLGWPAIVNTRPMVGGEDMRLRFVTAVGCALAGLMYAVAAMRLFIRRHR